MKQKSGEVGANFTIEAAILVPIFLLVIMLGVKGAVNLYEETVEMAIIEGNIEIDSVKNFRMYAFGEDIISFLGKKGD